MKAPDLVGKSDDEIDTWIANHERKGVTDTPLYTSLIEERNRRHGGGLRLAASIKFLIAAARVRRFVSYGELAEASGVAWTKARHRMNNAHGHLQDILNYCHAHRWPLLTAIVVQKSKLGSGDMDEFTLHGFCDGARNIGLEVHDQKAFLRMCQVECFTWAQHRNPGEPGIDT